MSMTTPLSTLQLCEACHSTGRRSCTCRGHLLADSSSPYLSQHHLLDHHRHPSPSMQELLLLQEALPQPPPASTVHEFQFFGRHEEEGEEEDHAAAGCWLLDNINCSSRPADAAAAGSYWCKTVDGFPRSPPRSPGPSLEISVMGVPAAISTLRESSTAVNTKKESGMTEREARILRYREKKQNRKFEKQIRYASRKAYAEKRRRIKGRFTKEKSSKANATAPPKNDHHHNFLALGR
ncbi:hypothetical protein ACLOJK_005614 [Asimina triloba]